MTAYCPDCLEVEAPPNAREGRCYWCRPSRRHSVPRPDPSTAYQKFVAEHRRSTR